jgi:S1-C subfamily serine protease
MSFVIKIFTLSLTAFAIQISGTAQGGILKSLDDELTSLVEKTEPYLVTVKGKGEWRNLIATGIIYDGEGYVITSSHVYDVDKHEITFKNGDSYSATGIGVDHQTGLAVLKIDDGNFSPPPWSGSSDLKSGAWIMVVGNSFGTPATVNFGIFEGRTAENYLKLGVGVSPGGSGGAVLNTDGEIVGAVIAREAGSKAALQAFDRGAYLASKLNFFDVKGDADAKAIAVPVETMKDVIDQLIKHGEIRRGFLGISQRKLSPEEMESANIDRGVMVLEVVEDSPAEDAGLLAGDIITEVDSESIRKTSDLYNLIRSRKPGDKVDISLVREGQAMTLTAELDDADDSALFGAWKLSESIPGLSVGRKIKLPDTEEFEKKMDKMKKDILRLQEELELLREQLKDKIKD